MKNEDVFFAVDLGGTGTSVALVSRAGKVLERARFATRDFVVEARPELFAEEVARQIQSLLAHFDGAAPTHLGLGAPNGNYFTGEVLYASNLAWRGVVPLAALVAKATGKEVVLENDANAAALGEARFGAGRGVDNFVAVTLGTGVGSGIVAGGQVVRGVNGFGGELGHLTVAPGGRVCGCGGLGCLETYASVTALIRTVVSGVRNGSSGSGDFDAEALEKDAESAGPIIASSARAGNPLALGAFQLAAESLGTAFAQVTTLLAPDRFILSGGMVAAEDLLMAPLKKRFAQSGARFHKPLPQIVLSKLGSGDAALLGAASLCFS